MADEFGRLADEMADAPPEMADEFGRLADEMADAPPEMADEFGRLADGSLFFSHASVVDFR
jgi:hypothetical protein